MERDFFIFIFYLFIECAKCVKLGEVRNQMGFTNIIDHE